MQLMGGLSITFLVAFFVSSDCMSNLVVGKDWLIQRTSHLDPYDQFEFLAKHHEWWENSCPVKASYSCIVIVFGGGASFLWVILNRYKY